MRNHIIPRILLKPVKVEKKVKLISTFIDQYKYVCNVMNYKSKMIEQYYHQVSTIHIKKNFKNSMKFIILYWCGLIALNGIFTPKTMFSTAFELFCLIFNLVCYLSTMFLHHNHQIEVLNVVVLLTMFISILVSMNNQPGMLETNFTPSLQVTLLMFSNLPMKLNNALMLWTVSYGILSLGTIISIGHKAGLTDFISSMLNSPGIENIKRLPLYEKNLDLATLIGALLVLAFGITILCMYLYFVNNFHRRSSFIKISNNIQIKNQYNAAKKVQLYWTGVIIPKSVKDEYWKHHKDFKVDKWIYIKSFDNVSLLFADVVGFTEMSANRTPLRVVELLNELFIKFDYLCSLKNCEKISTLGDCYYCVSGCPIECKNPTESIIEMGLGMFRVIKRFNREHQEKINVQIGIHSGRVNAAIIGKERCRFDVYSNDVNVAKAMESSGKIGFLHISQAVYDKVKTTYKVELGEKLDMPGDAKLGFIKTYFIDPKNVYIHGKDEIIYRKEDMRMLNACSKRYSSYTEDSNSSDEDDDNENATQKGSSTKSQYRNKIDNDIVFIDYLRYDQEENIKLLSDPPIRILSMKFIDDEIEWHFITHDMNAGNEVDLGAVKLTPFVDCLFSFFYSVIIYLTLFILFPDISLRNQFLIFVNILLSILILIIMFLQWYEVRYYVKRSLNNSIYQFMSRKFVIVLICLYFMTAPLAIIISVLFDCTKMYISYSFTIRYFTLVLFALFVEPLFLSANYFVKIIVCIFNISGAMAAFSSEPCIKRKLIYTFPYYSCFGQMNLTDVGFYASVKYNFLFQIGMTCILMILIFREIEINVRILFYITREVEINSEETLRETINTQELLYSIIPMYVFNELKSRPKNRREIKNFNYAVSIPKAAVVFACISNIYSKQYGENEKSAEDILKLLHKIICGFDEILKKPEYKDVEKIKTFNDCYILASGLNMVEVKKNKGINIHITSLMNCAFDMIESLDNFNSNFVIGSERFVMRIGYNFGPLTAGLIGGTKPTYDIWGDTVNLSNKMCTTGAPGIIQVPENVKNELKGAFEFRQRSKITVRGNKNMNTYDCFKPMDVTKMSSSQSGIDLMTNQDLMKLNSVRKKSRIHNAKTDLYRLYTNALKSYVSEERQPSMKSYTDKDSIVDKSKLSIRRSLTSKVLNEDNIFLGFTFK